MTQQGSSTIKYCLLCSRRVEPWILMCRQHYNETPEDIRPSSSKQISKKDAFISFWKHKVASGYQLPPGVEWRVDLSTRDRSSWNRKKSKKDNTDANHGELRQER